MLRRLYVCTTIFLHFKHQLVPQLLTFSQLNSQVPIIFTLNLEQNKHLNYLWIINRKRIHVKTVHHICRFPLHIWTVVLPIPKTSSMYISDVFNKNKNKTNKQMKQLIMVSLRTHNDTLYILACTDKHFS